MKDKYNLSLILLSNLLPLIGFLFFHWSMFAIIYLYWVQGIFVALSDSIKIVMSRGINEAGVVESKNKRISSAVKFFCLRLGIFFFYWIFLLAFVARAGDTANHAVVVQNYVIIFFMDKSFNQVLLATFIAEAIAFLGTFIATEDYKTDLPSKYKLFFDARTIIMHIVIVLGTFGSQFFESMLPVSKTPGFSYVILLVILKMIVELYFSRNKLVVFSKIKGIQ